MPDKKAWLLDQPLELVPFSKWQKTVDLMTTLFQAPAGFIVQHTHQGYQTTIASQQDENPYGPGVVIEPDENIFCRKIVQTGQELYVQKATEEHEWQTNPEVANDGFNSYLGVPIHWPNGQPFGTICVMDFKVTNYDDSYMELIRQFRDIVQADLLLLDHFDQFRELAMTDELTRLYNRRGFETVAEQRIQLAKRNDARLSLVYMDMNGLKSINDQLGHHLGDKALTYVADSLRQHFRSSDVLARIGGDEFLLLAETDNLNALNDSCDKVDQALKQYFSEHPTITTGVSFGVLQIDDIHLPLAHWINQADEKMYQHKSSRSA